MVPHTVELASFACYPLQFLGTAHLSVVKVRITKCVNVHRGSACIEGIFIMLMLQYTHKEFQN